MYNWFKKQRAFPDEIYEQEEPHFWVTKGKKINVSIIMISWSIFAVAISIWLINGSIHVGAQALQENYQTAYNAEKDNTYQSFYDRYFAKAEEAYHVSNEVAISISDLQKKNDLEVLQVSDVEYIIEDKQDNRKGITAWLEVPGEGTYVVNLQAAEFIVDNARGHVLVRLPYPELTNISIDYANVKKLMFKNDLLNESYSIGEELARKQLNSADALIKKELAANQYFYKSAQNAAESMIKGLVKKLNPALDNLQVEVEFIEV